LFCIIKSILSSGHCVFYQVSNGNIGRRLVAGFPPRRPGFQPRSGNVLLVVDKVALAQVFSEYFGFPCQFSFHRLLNIHLLSSGAGTIGQLVADVPSGLSLTPPEETKKSKKETSNGNHVPTSKDVAMSGYRRITFAAWETNIKTGALAFCDSVFPIMEIVNVFSMRQKRLFPLHIGMFNLHCGLLSSLLRKMWADIRHCLSAFCRTYCDRTPESRNSGARADVHC
jgi:hypothetical protein